MSLDPLHKITQKIHLSFPQREMFFPWTLWEYENHSLVVTPLSQWRSLYQEGSQKEIVLNIPIYADQLLSHGGKAGVDDVLAPHEAKWNPVHLERLPGKDLIAVRTYSPLEMRHPYYHEYWQGKLDMEPWAVGPTAHHQLRCWDMITTLVQFIHTTIQKGWKWHLTTRFPHRIEKYFPSELDWQGEGSLHIDILLEEPHLKNTNYYTRFRQFITSCQKPPTYRFIWDLTEKGIHSPSGFKLPAISIKNLERMAHIPEITLLVPPNLEEELPLIEEWVHLQTVSN